MVLNFFKKILRKKPKIIVILGQTATGKTSLAIEIAKQYQGEIISADSRQVYRGMDLGTAKVTLEEMNDIPHHMIDITNPDIPYTVSRYVKEGTEIINDILKRKNIPIICGGTGMYIDALVHHQQFPEVAPNKELRARLEILSTEELFLRLQQEDPKRAKTIDPYNKVRLVRALEVINSQGVVPPLSKSSPYNILFIGLEISQDELYDRIHTRIVERLDQGMLAEVEGLLGTGITHARLEELGLEYRYLSRYLREVISYQEMIEQLNKETQKFSKRQKTWFKRNKHIHWFHPIDDRKEILKKVETFLKK